MKKIRHDGFTVLELLVILGIIIILVALVLTALNATRSKSADERRVSLLRPVVIELREYFSICRSYPADLSQTELDSTTAGCSDLVAQGKKIRDVIPSAHELNFNNTDSPYYYQALEVVGLSGTCTNFHTWVDLQNPGGTLLQQKSNKTLSDYSTLNLSNCNGNQTAELSTNTETVYDIFK